MGTIEITLVWRVIFLVIAVIHTTFFTIFAFKIHSTSQKLINNHKENRNIAWFIFQYFFNFIGAAFAWCLLWILLPTYINAFSNQSIELIGVKEIILSIILLLGLSGYIPLTIYGMAISFSEIAKKLSK
ncbi:MAG: hypothetical protein JXJ22_03190 [Bacteroidales bacterium]|nr:hypothetical protein [Bacteroidales bacterium]